ncbi:MAG: hypothetical protein U9Q18_00845 [Caldisericota bacterium]|nr:hypothetical protein [Caldisericota bacterium]
MKRKFSLLISLPMLLTLGYIFAVFSVFTPEKRTFGTILLAATLVGHVFYLFGSEQRAIRNFTAAKKYLDKANSEKGTDLILKAIELTNNLDNIKYLVAGTCENPKSYKKAADVLIKKLKQKDTPFFRFVVASLFYHSANIRKTVELLKTINVGDSNIKIARLLGASLFELKRFEEAIEVFKQFAPPMLPMREDDLALLFGLGIAYNELGEKEKSKKYLVRVARKNPRFGGVDKILEKLEEESTTDRGT